MKGDPAGPYRLTGRIEGSPHELLREAILEPQFHFEASHLLKWYVATEKALLLEYLRLGILETGEAAGVAGALHGLTTEMLTPGAAENLYDMAFAIERHVEGRLRRPVPAWHVDRSRNDLQACAQLMFARDETLRTIDSITHLAASIWRRSSDAVDMVMPGYTHLQPAEVISPGFYLAAMLDETLHSAQQLLRTYDDIDACPLGAGAIAGQELAWDRAALAGSLGFARPQPHALVAVASRTWMLALAGDLAVFGVTLSRFTTDLMTWASGEYGFIDLPDRLSGISSAMPQKRNFPVLERIRGKTAHLTSYLIDMLTAQRGTPYANMVEVSKESSAHLLDLFRTAALVASLLTTVLDEMRFNERRMRAACAGRMLGGFMLANRLTLGHGIPWRTAQVVAGEFAAECVRPQWREPTAKASTLLEAVALRHGHSVPAADTMLREADDVDLLLRCKRSQGSTAPDQVGRLLADQQVALARVSGALDARRMTTRSALRRLDRSLGIGDLDAQRTHGGDMA